MIGVSAEINSPSVMTSTIWSPNFPFPLGRSIVIANPRVPGEMDRLVTNSRGALKDGPEGFAAISAKRRYKLVSRRVTREQCDHDHRGDDCDRQVQHRDEQHLGRGNDRLIRIAIDHCPEQGGENEESADHAKDDGVSGRRRGLQRERG